MQFFHLLKDSDQWPVRIFNFLQSYSSKFCNVSSFSNLQLKRLARHQLSIFQVSSKFKVQSWFKLVQTFNFQRRLTSLIFFVFATWIHKASQSSCWKFVSARGAERKVQLHVIFMIFSCSATVLHLSNHHSKFWFLLIISKTVILSGKSSTFHSFFSSFFMQNVFFHWQCSGFKSTCFSNYVCSILESQSCFELLIINHYYSLFSSYNTGYWLII